jgi:hypothetical protein
MKAASGLAAVGAIAALLPVGCGATTSAKPHDQALLPGITARQLQTLRARAIKSAKEMGESHPTGGVVVATTQHHFFNEMPAGPILYTKDFNAFVVGMNGNFTGYGASRPAGTPAPKGHFVYFVVRADTLDGTDSGILDQPLDLAKYGPHVSLDLG